MSSHSEEPDIYDIMDELRAIRAALERLSPPPEDKPAKEPWLNHPSVRRCLKQGDEINAVTECKSHWAVTLRNPVLKFTTTVRVNKEGEE